MQGRKLRGDFNFSYVTFCILETHRSKDDKMFAGIGLNWRIDVGGRVVEVRIGLLVDRV